VYHDTDAFMPNGDLTDFNEYDFTTLDIGFVDYDWEDLQKMLKVHRAVSGEFAPDPEDPDEPGWHADVKFRFDEETEHWLVLIDYTRDVTIPLLQNYSQIGLPFLCEHHGHQSARLNRELQTILDNYPRPWEDHDIPIYCGTSRRCAYCPTEFTIMLLPVVREFNTSLLEASSRKRAMHSLSIIRVIDLGSLYTPHTREWKALTTSWKGDAIERTPFHTKGTQTVWGRFMRGHGDNTIKTLDDGTLPHHRVLGKQ